MFPVASVGVFVCNVLTCGSFDLQSLFLICRYILRIPYLGQFCMSCHRVKVNITGTKKNVCACCLWVVCLRLKGSLVQPWKSWPCCGTDMCILLLIIIVVVVVAITNCFKVTFM